MDSLRSLPPIRAALFDMDGLLIDSEDMYTKSTNDILRKYGKPDLPWSIKAKLQGRPGPEAGKIFHAWAQLPINPDDFSLQAMELQAKYFQQTKPLPGVPALLKNLSHASSGIHLALATSSQRRNFMIKTAHLEDLFSAFPDHQRVLGDDERIPKGRGKPAPDIYLLALETINADIRSRGGGKEIRPAECLVFEDSVPGVEAGRRAGMQVVWCPHPGLLKEYAGREKEVLAGLTGEHEEQISQSTAVSVPAAGWPGVIDDGWATLLGSLEDFPYDQFGIKL